MDRIAREGLLFRNAFVNAPSCTPCRSSLLTGRYFFNCDRGAILQGAVWDSAIPSFPLLMRDAGYQIGKSHKVWSPGTPADAPFGGQKYAYQKAGNAANHYSTQVERMMKDGLPLAQARTKILGQVRDNFDAFLADRKEGRPWLYWFGPTTFFQELKDRFHAPGEFAQAYVIAHEIGHHVQNLLGISDEVRAKQQRMSKTEAKRMSVRLELQADFLAGVWAHHAQRLRHILEEGDIEDGLRAAAAIGDDRLQKQAQGYVVPDSFTHGSSEQRVRWFRKGLRTGDMAQGDTFHADEL